MQINYKIFHIHCLLPFLIAFSPVEMSQAVCSDDCGRLPYETLYDFFSIKVTYELLCTQIA